MEYYNNWKKFVLKESNKCSYYKRGMCDAYALALHRKTNYPLYVVRGYYWDDWSEEEAYEDAHMVVKKQDNVYLDVDGEKNYNELISNSMFTNKVEKVDIVPISYNEALYTFTMEGVSEEDIKEAEDYIEKNSL